jgi:hypothetical protein
MKKSIWAITGLVLILAAWEVNGTLVERHDALHEEGAGVARHAAGRSAMPQSAPKDAVSGHTADYQSSSRAAATAHAPSQH